MSTTLHFTLGPVQGFIAQARRTSDFWSGSFILSYLAGSAMAKVIEITGARLVLPAVEVDDKTRKANEPLLQAIMLRPDGQVVKDGPKVATLPNRFQAEVPDGFDPAVCEDAVRGAWRELATAVWDRYLAPVEHLGKGTREIWDRQVEGFWEINWVLGENPALMDRRKNWRSHVPPVEYGDKCTLMGNMQELSGYIRCQEKEKQDAFWAALRTGSVGHWLASKERLCAVALIKRLFPLIAPDVVWRVPQQYPSTPYLAAVPWIKTMIEKRPEDARKYAADASRLGGGYKENPEGISGIKGLLNIHPQAREFAGLDGNCFFAASLSNDNLWGDKPEKTREIRRALKGKLEDFKSAASPFYAMLLMDGDHLGKLLHEYGLTNVSAALGQFSEKVPQVVAKHDGVTVYAGGDDVLALLPLDGALGAALGLREAYAASFASSGTGGQATISGAIVYAHYTTPLVAVCREAHRLLDEVAKDRTGRDSLAVTVWKGVGRTLEWSQPWAVVQRENKSDILAEMVEALGGEGRAKEYNHSFFYNLRSRLESILTDEETGKAKWTEEELLDLLGAEYRKSREREVDWAAARERMAALLGICRCAWRSEDGGLHNHEGELTGPVRLDGALLVKFLSQKGVEM